MKKPLLVITFIFGLFILASVLVLTFQNPFGDLINSIGIAAILILFGFYPFNLLLLINHKKGVASRIEKALQWPYFGKASKIPTNIGPAWVNMLENAIYIVTLVPFLLILLLMWVAKTLFG